MTTETITVTNKDISEGQPRVASQCPIALAARRTFPGKRIKVYGYNLKVYRSFLGLEFGNVFYTLPVAAWQFVMKYDTHHMVEPISFVVVKQ